MQSGRKKKSLCSAKWGIKGETVHVLCTDGSCLMRVLMLETGCSRPPHIHIQGRFFRSCCALCAKANATVFCMVWQLGRLSIQANISVNQLILDLTSFPHDTTKIAPLFPKALRSGGNAASSCRDTSIEHA